MIAFAESTPPWALAINSSSTRLLATEYVVAEIIMLGTSSTSKYVMIILGLIDSALFFLIMLPLFALN
ncbi:hypothetical protein D3C78_1184990 [compost metagenome]